MARSKREVADRLHSSAIHLLRRLREVDAESGIGPGRLSALSVLIFRGPASVRELADIEMVRPPTMSEIIHGLEAGGLASKSPNPKDARGVIVRATSRGERLLQAARSRRIDGFESILAQAKPHELKTLDEAGAILERLLQQ
ncbi:MAG TPA: MarR family transcriptional regulator [Candidatus Aquilonibacter sp.]